MKLLRPIYTLLFEAIQKSADFISLVLKGEEMAVLIPETGGHEQKGKLN